MPAWRIELLATDPIGAAAPDGRRTLWELGGALAQRGHSVRVLHTSGEPPARAAASGVVAVHVPGPPARPSPVDREIALGRNVADLIEPSADLVVGRDEVVGALGWTERGRRHPAVALLLDDEAVRAFAPPGGRERGIRARIGDWLDRRPVRKLQATALSRARVVLVTSELHRTLLESGRTPSGPRVGVLPAGVPAPIDVGSREAARAALQVPLDVHVAAFLAGSADVDGRAVALEAFERVRPIFPGARLLMAGKGARSEPGVMPFDPADEEARARVLRASDVALFPYGPGTSGLAPREAMRYGIATVTSRRIPLDGADPERATRRVPADDSGEYASALAELFAEPDRRRAIAAAGRAYADTLTFEKMAEAFEGELRSVLT
jgi:hypothetical protein